MTQTCLPQDHGTKGDHLEINPRIPPYPPPPVLTDLSDTRSGSGGSSLGLRSWEPSEGSNSPEPSWTKASDNKTFRDVIAEQVHGKWLRNMYCDIPVLRFFGLVG